MISTAISLAQALVSVFLLLSAVNIARAAINLRAAARRLDRLDASHRWREAMHRIDLPDAPLEPAQ